MSQEPVEAAAQVAEDATESGRKSWVIDIRPLREITGRAMFNEVFLDEVFVPDDRVVGEPGGGWRIARSALATERLAMGRGSAFGDEVEGLLAAIRAAGLAAALAASASGARVMLCDEQAEFGGALLEIAVGMDGIGVASALQHGKVVHRVAEDRVHRPADQLFNRRLL